jgi:hypothetical protein
MIKDHHHINALEKEKENCTKPCFEFFPDSFLGKSVLTPKAHYPQHIQNKKHSKEPPIDLTYKHVLTEILKVGLFM